MNESAKEADRDLQSGTQETLANPTDEFPKGFPLRRGVGCVESDSHG
jgi:hypothetical protein